MNGTIAPQREPRIDFKRASVVISTTRHEPAAAIAVVISTTGRKRRQHLYRFIATLKIYSNRLLSIQLRLCILQQQKPEERKAASREGIWRKKTGKEREKEAKAGKKKG